MVRILVTGAFGNLGQMVIEEARRQGFAPVAADLDTPSNRRVARRYALEDDVLWGDIRQLECETALRDVIAVIHLAAVLPPATDHAPELAHGINVEATVRLIETMERAGSPAVLVYPSSVTVYGPPSDRRRLHRVDDPTRATDNYSAHKLEVEQRLSRSSIRWAILRVGVSVDGRTLATDTSTMRQLFAVSADNALEYVHPRDVARAMINVIRRPHAHQKVLLIGGGERCRVTQHEFLSAGLDALGLELPRELLGDDPYYTCWMDTAESQALLEFQQHSFADYREEMRRRLRWARVSLAPFRPCMRWGLKRFLAR